MMKILFFFAIVMVAYTYAGVLPLAATYAAAPYATSYSAHVVNHAIAHPYVAAAPVVASAPLVAPAPLAYTTLLG